MPAGRPTQYSDELAQEILEHLADGRTLNSICKEVRFPNERTVRRWALDPQHEFSPKYARAREIGYHSMADDILEIADNACNDWMVRHGDDDAGWQANGDHIQRSRLRIDSRKWLLSKALPKIYGDKLALTDSDGGPLKVQVVRFGANDPDPQ